jgi:hypothetical protein
MVSKAALNYYRTPPASLVNKDAGWPSCLMSLTDVSSRTNALVRVRLPCFSVYLDLITGTTYGTVHIILPPRCSFCSPDVILLPRDVLTVCFEWLHSLASNTVAVVTRAHQVFLPRQKNKPDSGSRLVTAGDDGILRVWDMRSGDMLFAMQVRTAI